MEELKAQFAGKIQDVRFLSGRRTAQDRTGIPLVSVIQAAGSKPDKGIRHHDLKFLAIVERTTRTRLYSRGGIDAEVGNARRGLSERGRQAVAGERSSAASAVTSDQRVTGRSSEL